MSFGYGIGDFIAAIKLANNIRKEFLDVPVDSKDETGRKLLSYAAEEGQEGIFKLLVEASKVDVNSEDENGWKLLSYAAEESDEELVKLLVETSKVDVNSKDEDDWKLLSYAAEEWHEGIVRLLLETGTVDVESKDENGRTLLSYAANSWTTANIQLLLDEGADIESKDEDGQTPLLYAASSLKEANIHLLLKMGANIAVANNDGWTPLHAASNNGHVYIIQLLLKMGANIAVASNDGWTPLHAASDNGHVDIVQLLLENGANIAVASNDGWTPLYMASDNGHVDIVQLLLKMGANIGAASNKGWTPLHVASNNGHIDIVQLLLEKDADVAVASNDGWTPLQAASSNGHVDIVQLLLEKGADVAVTSNDGWTPLQAASSNGHVDIVQLLLEKGADVAVTGHEGWTPLHIASSNGHVDIVHLLLEKGADVAVTLNNGWTPLHAAAFKGHTDVTQLLLEKGANVGAKDNVRRTPLFHAAQNGNEATVKVLLATNQVGIDTKDYYNSTTLSIAARMGHKDIVALLLTKGHALNIKDHFGRTPLWWAKAKGYPEIINLLLQKYEDEGIIAQEDDLSPTLISVPSDECIKLCDVCFLGISNRDTYDHCCVCNNGDFDICKECIAMEARCLDESHELVKEVNRKRIVHGAALKHPEEIPLGQPGQDKAKVTGHSISQNPRYTTKHPDQGGKESIATSRSKIRQHQRKLKLSSFSLWLMSILNPPPPDCHRIKYICGCGDDLYVDVKELSPGGIERFKKSLLDAASAIRTLAQGSDDRTSLPGPPPPAHLSSSNQAPLSSTGPQGRRLDHLLSRQSALQSIETQSQTPALTRNVRYVLLCVNTKKLKALTQVEVGSIGNDEYLFRDIRDAYMHIRRPNEWKFSMLLPSVPGWILGRFPIRLREWSKFIAWLGDASIHVPRTADFVRFQLIPVRMELCPAHIKKPSFPPEDEVRARRYLYSPCPMDVEIYHVPFIHELLKPGAHLGDYWLTLIPKKLQDPLEWTRERAVIGWGIQINEGINWKVILAFILLCLILTGLGVGLYAAIRGDLSTAASLGAYIAAVIAIVLQLQYYVWVDG